MYGQRAAYVLFEGDAVIGENSIVLNHATVKQILEDYLNHTLFAEGQLPVAVEAFLESTTGEVNITFKTLPPKTNE